MLEKTSEEIRLIEENRKRFEAEIYPMLENGEIQNARNRTAALFSPADISGLKDLSEFDFNSSRPKTAQIIPVLFSTTLFLFIQWLFPDFSNQTLGLPKWFFWATLPLPFMFTLILFFPLIFRKRNEKIETVHNFLETSF